MLKEVEICLHFSRGWWVGSWQLANISPPQLFV